MTTISRHFYVKVSLHTSRVSQENSYTFVLRKPTLNISCLVLSTDNSDTFMCLRLRSQDTRSVHRFSCAIKAYSIPLLSQLSSTFGIISDYVSRPIWHSIISNKSPRYYPIIVHKSLKAAIRLKANPWLASLHAYKQALKSDS